MLIVKFTSETIRGFVLKFICPLIVTGLDHINKHHPVKYSLFILLSVFGSEK